MLLRLAVDHVVVRVVLLDVKAVVPAGAVRQRGAAARGGGTRCLGASIQTLQRRAGAGLDHDLPVQRVVVVHRHVHADRGVVAQRAEGRHGVEGEEHMGDAPVVRVVLGRAVSAVGSAEVGVDRAELCRAGLGAVPGAGAGLGLLQRRGAAVQEGGVDGVHFAFPALHPVTRPVQHRDLVRPFAQHVSLDIRQRRRSPRADPCTPRSRRCAHACGTPSRAPWS